MTSDTMNDLREDEATRRWCPHARNTYHCDDAPSTDYAPPHNRFNGVPKEAECIGSQCMAWRWTGRNVGRCGLAG